MLFINKFSVLYEIFDSLHCKSSWHDAATAELLGGQLV